MKLRNEYEDAIDRRHKIIDEINRLMEGAVEKDYDLQNKILSLLKESSRLRSKLVELSKMFSEDELTGREMEYYRTILDYIGLVDCEREEAVLKNIMSIASKYEGPLSSNLEWIKKQLEELRKLKERVL